MAGASVDLAFECGVLIHVSPDDLLRSYQEIHPVSRAYVLSIEYFCQKPQTIPYRGHSERLFKRDFGRFWLKNFSDLDVVDYGFFWKPITGLDDVTWWLFGKKKY